LLKFKNSEAVSVPSLPLVAVSIPVLNRVDFILDAVQSALRQDYSNFKVVVLDGGSTDGTLELLDSILDERLEVLKLKNAGSPCAAVKRCMELPEAEIIVPLMSDDFFVDKRVLSFFVDHLSTADFVYGDVDIVERVNVERVVREFKCRDYNLKDIKSGLHPCWASIGFKKSLLSVIEFNPDGLMLACDFDYSVKLYSDDSIIKKYVCLKTTAHRLGGASSRNLLSMLLGNWESCKCWSLNKIEAPSFFFFKKVFTKFEQFKFGKRKNI
jgi:glycosyltransferase involved in cell wall biosynthesis